MLPDPDDTQTGGDVIGVDVWLHRVGAHAEGGTGILVWGAAPVASYGTPEPHRAIPCDPAEIRNRVVRPWEDAGNRDWSSAEREAFDRGVDAVLALLGLHS